MARHIKTGDQVMVIAGSDKGRVGKVLKILVDKGDTGRDRVVVEGINRKWKHVRPNQQNQKGGRIQKDNPIHISNVLPVDPATGKGSRVRFTEKDGKKVRTSIGGSELGTVASK